MGEAVNHPAHYNAHPSGVECIDVVADGQAMMNSFYGRHVEFAPKPAKKSAKDLAGEMVDRIKEARKKRGAPVPLVGANARGKTVNAGEKRWGVYCKECNIQKAGRWINDQGVCITCERGGPAKVEGADRGGCVVYRDETVMLDG